MDALLIRSPFIDMILDRKKNQKRKTWEIRGSRTKKCGRIGLIQSGSGTIIGVANLKGFEGPLTRNKFVANASKMGVKKSDLAAGLPYSSRTFAWVLSGAKRLRVPVRYKHPSGAVIWVKLSAAVSRAIERQLTR